MRKTKRRIAAGLTLLACGAGFAASASADVSPDPYKTTKGTGAFTGSSIVGPSTCALTNLNAKAKGTARGAQITVRGFEATCEGVITAARYDGKIRLRVRNGKVAGRVAIVIDNVLGGTCRYAGLVEGSARRGSDTVNAAGQVVLGETVVSPCAPSSEATLQIKFPGAKFTW